MTCLNKPNFLMLLSVATKNQNKANNQLEFVKNCSYKSELKR